MTPSFSLEHPCTMALFSRLDWEVGATGEHVQDESDTTRVSAFRKAENRQKGL
jgi:hypothetical protein